ncbi:MAG TPA: sigma-54 dependent transcriptional regulator [Candidatus Eisenbacteria bacterium]|nr:sigma-54 dependent transcriptional regulator [Candidatus Eisenbacteria bacterium]
MIGRSRAMARVAEQVHAVAGARSSVLIEGESGTGRTHVAHAIHALSPRHAAPCVTVSCSAVTGELLEAELFGRDAGAGDPGHPGAIERAEHGTLVLDDVGALPPPLQARLVRVIQERTFERLGDGRTRHADVRIASTTERDLEPDVRGGRFREDLWYRLSVVRIALPPLRERREDIPLLAEAFLRQARRDHGRRVTGMTRGALERLVRHDWPGNVRELRAALEGMVVFAEGQRALDLSDLPPALRGGEDDGGRLDIRVGATMDEAEHLLIAATLRHTGGDKTRAAAMLGIGLRTLYRKIRKYGIG